MISFFTWTHGEQELERFLKDLPLICVLLIKLAKIAFHFEILKLN